LNVLVTTIGTGGHIYPALEVARHLKAQGALVTLLVRAGVIESKVVEGLPYGKFSVRASGFAGKSMTGKAYFVWALLGAVRRLNIFMKAVQIKAVFGTGGFGMVPAILVALWQRIPFYILEMNRQPGLVTKIFSRFARLVYLALPLDKALRGRTRVIGVPIREQFNTTRWRPQDNFIIVLGGSQGAKRLNEAAVQLASARPDLRLRIITGMRDYHLIKEQVGQRPIEVIGFTDQPWQYLGDVALAVSRSGSNTVYELLTIGIPMVLIPFPYAILDHQLANARYLEENGAAVVITEDRLNVESLTRTVDRLLADRTSLNLMHERGLKLVVRNSAQKIASGIIHECVSLRPKARPVAGGPEGGDTGVSERDDLGPLNIRSNHVR